MPDKAILIIDAILIDIVDNVNFLKKNEGREILQLSPIDRKAHLTMMRNRPEKLEVFH